jgi:mannosyltransferase
MLPPEPAAIQQAKTSGSRTAPFKLAHGATLLLLLGFALLLRFACLDCKPFWSDECFSAEIAKLSWGNFVHLLCWREANMSLYYLLLRLWTHFGWGEFYIRSLSVTMAAATLPAIYWLAKQLYDRKVALLSVALLAVNAFHIRYAQEARTYTLFVLLTTLSSGCLVALLRKPSRGHWIAYVATSILAAYAHFYALLLLLVQWCILRYLGTPTQGQGDAWLSRPFGRAWKVVAVAVLPLLIFVAKTGAGPIRWITRPGVRDVLTFFEHLSGAIHWPLATLIAVAGAAAVVPFGRQLLTRYPSWETWRVQFLVAWFLGPIILTIIFSFARPVFLPRYMIFCLPPLLILAAAVLAQIRNTWLFAISVAAILLLSLEGVFFIYGHDYDNERDASGAAVNFILEHSQPGDAIIFHIAATRIPYEFFHSLRVGNDSATPEILFPHNAASLDYRDFTGKPTVDLVRMAAPTHHRVWLMLMNNTRDGEIDPTTKMLDEVMPQYFPNVSRWQFPKVEVRLYAKE